MRVVVVHYEAAEAASLVDRLRRDGFDAEPYRHLGPKGFRELRGDPPDAILIDLMRMPSYGRAMGALLREQKGTRAIPLVFLAGEPAKTAQTKALLPDAGYATLPRVGEALRKAAARPPSDPVVPDASGIPFARKLRIKEGATVGLVGAPDDFVIDGVAAQRGRRDTDVVLVFVQSVPALARELPRFADLSKGRALWLLWPKKSSRPAGDISLPRIHEACGALGLTAYKTCAVDAKWSAAAVSRRRSRA